MDRCHYLAKFETTYISIHMKYLQMVKLKQSFWNKFVSRRHICDFSVVSSNTMMEAR